jgi:hypothetical protein
VTVGAGWCGRDKCTKAAFDWLCGCVEMYYVLVPLFGVSRFGDRVTVGKSDVVSPSGLFGDFMTSVGDGHSCEVKAVWMIVDDMLNDVSRCV